MESERWNRMFRRLDGSEAGHDSWLGRWTDALGNPVLDLGCGAGHDARFLTRRGFPVVAVDFSEEALRLTRRNAPEADVRLLDMADDLPFPDESFGAVVASLSLHYFPWRDTVGISAEIQRCLEPGGRLFARFNSTNDEFHKNAEKEEIEDKFHLVNGVAKRLFDRESIEALFGKRWRITSAEETTTGRFGSTKTVWEVVAKKSSDAAKPSTPRVFPEL